MPTLAPPTLRAFASQLLRAAGATETEAAEVARILVEADLRDHASHGVSRLPGYCEALRRGSFAPGATPVIERDGGSTVLVDARRGLGQLAAAFAVDLAAERARARGIAAVGMRRAGHMGRLADVAARGAAAGIVTLVWANDSGHEHSVRPPGGVDGRLSTNPVAAGIPRRRPPHLVLDMATAVKSHGDVRLRAAAGEPVPEEWVEDGWLRPLGGHKGFGLALVAETLAGVLSGAGHVGAPDVFDYQGLFLVAIDPARFLPAGGLEDALERIADHLRAGGGTVLLPGEAGEAAARRNAGGVEVAQVTWDALAGLAAELGVAVP